MNSVHFSHLPKIFMDLALPRRHTWFPDFETNKNPEHISKLMIRRSAMGGRGGGNASIIGNFLSLGIFHFSTLNILTVSSFKNLCN